MSLVPRSSRSDADDAAFLSSRYGLAPDDWQFLVLRGWLGIRRDGMWAASRCGLAVPRQNGKNALLEMRELFGMVVLGEKFLHTAHEVKTARKAFLRLRSFFENTRQYPELAALVVDIRQTNGQEAVVLANGGSCEFVARSKDSSRGFTVDVLVCDEAQQLGDDALEALAPTTAAAPLGNPQHIFTGTPPGPKADGEVFTRLRNDGLGRRSRRLSWQEWSCEPTADLDDPMSVAQSNPAVGIRLGWQGFEDARGEFTDEGFGRERLGMWDEAATSRIIDAQTWTDRADDVSKAVDRLALAVDVSPDRSVASVAVAGQRVDGGWHVELDEQREGVGWLPAYVADRCERNTIRTVVIDGASPAASIIDELRSRKVSVTTTSAQDMARACGTFYDGAHEGWLHHIDQRQLNVALSVARKRSLGDGQWAWNRKTTASDITPLVAVTLALFGAQSSQPLERRSNKAYFA